MELTPNDLLFVVQRLPKDIRALLSENPRSLYVGGGFVRACIAGETPSDIDVFGNDTGLLEALAKLLQSRRGPETRVHTTKNAITVLTPNRLPVQFIKRWTFGNAAELVASFDFTVCQAAVWRDGDQSNSSWKSIAGEGFYIDLAGRRLVYTSPVREEEAGGSLLRALKYTKRGYSIQVASLGAVVARLAVRVRDSYLTGDEAGVAQVITGLLREVDPLLVIDGFDVEDDHEPKGDAT